MDTVRQIFINRYSEIRSGWKVMMFTVITLGLIYGLTAPLLLLKLNNEYLVSLLGLVGALAGTYVMMRFVNRKPLAAIGLWFHERTVQEFLWGNLIGFLMIASIFLVLYCLGDIDLATKGLSWSDCFYILSSSILFFAVGALIEEVIFRGYPFQTLIQGMTLIPAVFLMAVLFGLAHLGNPNASAFGIINVVLAAIWLSIAYLKTRGLWLPFGLHLGWNFSQTTLFSFPTSGVEFTEHKLFASTVTAPEWLAGGSFGPEGGALATAAIIVGTWYLLKSKRFAAAEGIITLESVEDLRPLPGNVTQNAEQGEAT